jgi:hypothetical protein
MKANLAQAIRTILTADGDGRIPEVGDPDFFFVHTVVNYARAKQEADHLWKAMALSRESRTGPGDRLLFQSLIKNHFPRLEQAQIDALYEAIERDNLD